MSVDDEQDLIGQAISGYSANKNDIGELKVGQGRLEQKLDDYMGNTNDQLKKILDSVNYTNGKVRDIIMWRATYLAEQKGIEKGKAIATGKEPRFTATQVKVAIVTGITSVIIAVIAVWDHYISKKG